MRVYLAKRLYGWLSLVFLGMGMGIYLFFRGLNMLLFEWIPKPAALGVLYTPLPAGFFTSILKYNAPDVAWLVSGICLLRFIWFYNQKWQGIYLCGLYGIAFIFEMAQLSAHIPGTFDPLDLLGMGIGAFIEGLLYINLIERSLK